MDRWVKTLRLYGEPANIYDFLIRLRNHNPGFPKRRFTFYTAVRTETRIVLAVFDWEGENSGVACLEITALPKNICLVDCIDGHDPFHNYDNRPIGQGFYDLMEWFEKECLKGGLVVPTQQEGKTDGPKPKEATNPKEKSERIKKRQADVKKLHGQALTQKEIAKQLVVSLATIKRDYRDLRLTKADTF